MLAEYDAASRYATDAVVGLKPAHGVVARNIARKSDGRWVVALGRFNETKDAFLIVDEATQGGSLEQFSSLESSHLEKRPYNAYVLRWDSG